MRKIENEIEKEKGTKTEKLNVEEKFPRKVSENMMKTRPRKKQTQNHY